LTLLTFPDATMDRGDGGGAPGDVDVDFDFGSGERSDAISSDVSGFSSVSLAFRLVMFGVCVCVCV